MFEVPDEPTRQKIDWMVGELCSEFADQFSRAQITEVMDDSVERLMADAKVMEYLPLIAYRFARERLRAIDRAQGEDRDGTWDVVFVSLSGGGRGQIAAALTTLLSGNRVSVHSAGTAVHGEIDPGVQSVIAELGVDRDDAFAKPVTDEILRAADVIVTMGHSVGVFDMPPIPHTRTGGSATRSARRSTRSAASAPTSNTASAPCSTSSAYRSPKTLSRTA